MKVLVVQNFEDEGLGQIGKALAEAGAVIDLRRPYRGDELPGDSSAHDAMIVLGGGQNALDDAGSPYFPALLDLMRDFSNKRPVAARHLPRQPASCACLRGTECAWRRA